MFHSGRQYDKHGNLHPWWDNEVITAFNEAKQCFIDQYGGYVVPQLNRTVSFVSLLKNSSNWLACQ